MVEKIVLAYSGGLDTTVAIPWLIETYGYDVIACTIDVGNEKDFTAVRGRALAAGASKVFVRDGKEDFIRYFAFPALAAGAVYQRHYPLATALSRPLMAKLLVDVAQEVGAAAVAHGCTGKGNDQVRFDVGVRSLGPKLKIVAPMREWKMSREDEIAYAEERKLSIGSVTRANPYSTDENLWGRSIEAGVLEDPWNEPPEDIYSWTRSVANAPDEPATITIDFRQGRPISIDGKAMDGETLVRHLNELAGLHGIGRIDMVEDRLVGIKSREIYESPAAVTLLAAHEALEHMTMSKPQLRLKERVAQEYADLIYNGLWFTAHHQDMAAYVRSTQRYVTGEVRMRLHKGTATPVGRKAEHSLYSYALATYDRGDQFDQGSAPGFIDLWGLPVRVQAEAQLLTEPGSPLRITAPEE